MQDLRRKFNVHVHLLQLKGHSLKPRLEPIEIRTKKNTKNDVKNSLKLILGFKIHRNLKNPQQL